MADTQADRKQRRNEVLATVLMSLAVVGSSFCAWQSARWGGVQAIALAEAAASRVEASRASNVGISELVYDASSFMQIAIKFSEGDEKLARELGDRFLRKEFQPYVEQWISLNPRENPDAPRNPFELKGFKNEELVRAAELEQQATLKTKQAEAANQNSDDYILATVFFATVLFVTGMVSKVESPKSGIILLGLAIFAFSVAMWRMLTLPFH